MGDPSTRCPTLSINDYRLKDQDGDIDSMYTNLAFLINGKLNQEWTPETLRKSCAAWLGRKWVDNPFDKSMAELKLVEEHLNQEIDDGLDDYEFKGNLKNILESMSEMNDAIYGMKPAARRVLYAKVHKTVKLWSTDIDIVVAAYTLKICICIYVDDLKQPGGLKWKASYGAPDAFETVYLWKRGARSDGGLGFYYAAIVLNFDEDFDSPVNMDTDNGAGSAPTFSFYIHGLLPISTANCNMTKTSYVYANVCQDAEPITVANDNYQLRYPSDINSKTSTVKDLKDSPQAFQIQPYSERPRYVLLDDRVFDMHVTSFQTVLRKTSLGALVGKTGTFYNNVFKVMTKYNTVDERALNFQGSPCDWPFQWYDMLHTIVDAYENSSPADILSFSYFLCTSTVTFNIQKIYDKDIWIGHHQLKKIGISNESNETKNRPFTDVPIIITYLLHYDKETQQWEPTKNSINAYALVKFKFSQFNVNVKVSASDLEQKSRMGDDDRFCEYGETGKKIRYRFKPVELKALLSWTYQKINRITGHFRRKQNYPKPVYWSAHTDKTKRRGICKSHEQITVRRRGYKTQLEAATALQTDLLSQFDKKNHMEIDQNLLRDMIQYRFTGSVSGHVEYGYGYFPFL